MSTLPEGKHYEIEGLENRLYGIRGLYLKESVEWLYDRLVWALKNQLGPITRFPSGSEWLIQVAMPRETQAIETELTLAKFKRALDDPKCSYVTRGHSVSPHSYHIYHSDEKSPTGVYRAGGAYYKDNPYIVECVEAMMKAKGRHFNLSRSLG